MISLKQLRYFVAVAETLNFREAADKVFLSQPSLSQQVKKLESELGIALLDRDQHHVDLTPAGAVFLKEAKAALAQVELAVRSAQEVAGVAARSLVIGVPEALTGDLLPLVERFRRSQPDLQIEVVEHDTPDLITGIRSGRVNIGLAGLAVNDASIDTRKVLSIPFVVALPEAHLLAREPSLHLKDLRGEDFILLPRKDLPPLHDYLMGFFQAAGLTPRVVKRANRFQQVMSLVASGVGINVCPASYTKLSRPGVSYVPLEPPRPTLTVVAAWSNERPPEVLDAFFESLAHRES